MRKIFVSLFLVSIFFTPVFADSYFPYGEITENRYYDTLGYGIGKLLDSERCPNGVEYNIGDIYGTGSSNILSNTHIDDITDADWRYGLIRLHGIYDEVALPPYSSMDFLYWSKNMAGEDVNIFSLKVFLSRKYSYQGDLRNILDIDGVYELLPIRYLAWDYPREGIVKTYDGIGVVEDSGGVLEGIRLDRVYMKSPLRFLKWEAEELEDKVLLRVFVKNESEEDLLNTEYSHQDYTEKRNFNANQEHIYEYMVEMDSNGSVGYPGIYNPNIRKECVVRGEHLESNFVGDSPMVGGIREEDGGYLAYIGSRVKPYGYRFCVTRIAYTLYAGEIVLNSSPEVEVEDTVPVNPVVEEVEEVVQEEDIPEVLGIKELPKTSV